MFVFVKILHFCIHLFQIDVCVCVYVGGGGGLQRD